jgi:hypothetical protein
MRSRSLCTAAALVVGLTTAAVPASGAAMHGIPIPRTTTLRAACAGGGSIAVRADQPGDGSLGTTVTISHVPLDSTWAGEIEADDSDGGGGAGFSGLQPDTDGTITANATVFSLVNPVVTVEFHSDDNAMSCTVRMRVERQFARTSCSLADRQISVTAVQDGADLKVTSSLAPVRPKSAWNVRTSVRSPHANEGAAAATHASPAGIVRSTFAFGYAVNRTVTVGIANPAGNGCEVSLGTHRLPPG